MPSEIVEKAKTHGAKLVAEYSVNDVKGAFNDWLNYGASPEEMHLLTESFAIATSGGENILEVIMAQVGLRNVPPEAKPSTTAEVGDPQGKAARRLDVDLGTYDFAENLETAQMMWRKYPDLVESEDFPEPFLGAMRRHRPDVPPHDRTLGLDDEELIKAGILPQPRRMRFNRGRLQQLIQEELISGFDEIAGRWANNASAEDLAVMHALLNTNRKPLDVLQDLLICDQEREEEREPDTVGNEPGSRSSEAHSAVGGAAS